MGTWVGLTPQLRRIPQQLVLLPVIWLALAGLSRLRLARWSLAVVTGILALGCMAIGWLAFQWGRQAYSTGLPFVFVQGIFLFGTHMCTLLISTRLFLP